MRSFRLMLVLAVLPLVSAPGSARQEAPARSPRNASYVIEAVLDPATRTLTGTGQLTWRNVSNVPATELRFHLYWNAWRDTQSSWMREWHLARNQPVAAPPASDLGSIDVTRLIVAGQDALPAARFIAPDDGNAQDRTVLQVPLARPLAPGETVAIDLGWTSRVPRPFRRAGAVGNYFFIAQWFPKIGVLRRRRLELSPISCRRRSSLQISASMTSVSLCRPAGSSAPRARERSKIDRGNGTTTHRYTEADVHDFAWTTSPAFVERHDRFEAPGLPAVDIRLLLQPEHTEQADRHFSAARAALKYYGEWFGPYPYGHLTIVDPIASFSAAQGGSDGRDGIPDAVHRRHRWYAPWTEIDPESLTVHEAGHQWWHGMVATNEVEHAWMDEGLNTFAEARVVAAAWPRRFVAVKRYFGGLIPWSFADVPWSRDLDGGHLDWYRPAARADVQATPSWRYWPGRRAEITYLKTALWLGTLEKQLGWPTLQRILSTYFQRGAFRHPTPEEFFAIAGEMSGRDLTAFFDAVHRSSATFDYGVAQVTMGAGQQTVVVRRYADGVFPTTVRVRFDDGKSVDEAWDGTAPWHAFRYATPARITSVEVDPDRVLLLDLNYTNNSWTSRPSAAAASGKWALRWLTWLEDVLLTYAFFV